MAAFPIFENLRVTDYGLYPGDGGSGLDIAFDPGLTMVLGANGLGKTTLVTMLYRLCTGPYDIPGLEDSRDLGTRSLQARRLARARRRLFAERVTDEAASAQATLVFTLGGHRMAITRSLDSLELLGLTVDGQDVPHEEEHLHELILEHSKVASFGDWILLLQHLTFYFETRRTLIWDETAQRQLLRILLLPSDKGSEWTRRERKILQVASERRNLSAALAKQEQRLSESESLVTDLDEVRVKLQLCQKLRHVDEARLQRLEDALPDEEAARENARLGFVKAEADHESAYRDLERRQLLVIAAAFPDKDDTARYLLGKLFSEGMCLACGHQVPRPLRNWARGRRPVTALSAIARCRRAILSRLTHAQ